MWKFSGFKKMEIKGVQVVRLYLVNEVNDSKVHLDCDISLDKYNVSSLIGQEYKQFNTVKELVDLYKLTERTVSNDFVRISSFKIGA